MKNPLYTSSEVDEWGRPESPIIQVHNIHGRPRMVPIGVTICHLINSLHSASTYGRRGLSSKVGNRSLPITISSSPCARVCPSGKRTRARKKEYIHNTVLNLRVIKNNTK